MSLSTPRNFSRWSAIMSTKILLFFLISTSVLADLKSESVRSDFLNYGTKKVKPGLELENEILKSKVEVLGEVLKHHVQALRKVPGQRIELVFLVDASASVGAENFFNEVKFVKKLLADFAVSYNQTRVAVITFSSKSKVIRHIDHVTQASEHNHKCTLLERELPRIRYSGGGTYTLGAMLEAQSVLALSRPDATKAVFLVTDGYSNGGDPKPAAAFLRARGVRIFTFGIHNGNVQELYDMASEPKEEHSYIVDSFEEFEALARRALHEDLHSGVLMAQDPRTCNKLCTGGQYCCDAYATCTCGTHTGHYTCTCQKGYYGTGLRGDCHPCPAGTYRDTQGPGDESSCTPCPDSHMMSDSGSTSAQQCYCKRGYNQVGMQCFMQQCPALMPPENGYFVRNVCSNVVNAACGVRCNPGYTLRGSSIRLCGDDGTWSGGDTQCVMKSCPKLRSPSHGTMLCSQADLTMDTQCHFACDPGYQLVGSKMRTCLPVAMWDGIPAYCKPIFCSALPQLRNGQVRPASCMSTKSKYGTRCEFACNAGYQINGPTKTTCVDPGIWSEGKQVPRCVDVTPPVLQCPENQTLATELHEVYALVSWDPPFVKDNSKAEVRLATIPATSQPMKMKIGTHNITYIAKDKLGNKATCYFSVTVLDEEPPRIDHCDSPPIFLSHEDEVDVYWEEPIFSDNSGRDIQVTRSLEPGQFPQGDTLVEYVAVDEAGNVATCNITITVQQHACQLPVDPINGAANCTENPDAVYCSFTCEEGYAFAMRPQQDYFCAYDGIWQPDDNPVPFPDCSVTSISNSISQSGEMAMEDDGSVCDDIFFIGQVENELEKKLEEALSEMCADDVVCEVAAVEAVCESILSEVEEEFNSINYYRKRRSADDIISSYWPVTLSDVKDDWVYWFRGKGDVTPKLRRRKRDNSFLQKFSDYENTERHKRQFGFSLDHLFGSSPTTKSPVQERITADENYLGVLIDVVTRSMASDIGFARFGSFLSNLKSEDGEFSTDDFLRGFSREFGEEKAAALRELATKKLNSMKIPELTNPLSLREENNTQMTDNTGSIPIVFPSVSNRQRVTYTHSSSSSFNNWDNQGSETSGYPVGLGQHGNNEFDIGLLPLTSSFGQEQYGSHYGGFHQGQTSSASGHYNVGSPYDYHTLPNAEDGPEQTKKTFKLHFKVEGHGASAIDQLQNAVDGILEAANNGQLDVSIGEHQLQVAAIRLKDHPEFICDPGSVSIDNLCVKCPVGTFFNVVLRECLPCPQGSFQPKEGQVSCLVCPPNTSTKTGNAKTMKDCKAQCLPGSFSGDGLEPCTTCDLGHYQDEYASLSCAACPVNTTTWRRGSWIIEECKPSCEPGQVSETGLQPCFDCPLGFFQENSGQQECFMCPEGASTRVTGSTSYTDCDGISQGEQAAYTSLETLAINDCFSDPCLNGGSCTPMEFGYVCQCVPGYSGQQCESEVNECESEPCLNNGTCVDHLNAFQCDCRQGFSGVQCEDDINECNPDPCENGATCVDLVDAFKCVCQSGYTGEICDIDIDECAGNPCGLGATCEDRLNDMVCLCPPGVTGRFCKTQINECESSPCVKGLCLDLANGFRCVCEPGYTGETCEENINDCADDPCANGGTCTDWINGFSCACSPGFTGKNCETEMSTEFIVEFPSSGIVDYAIIDQLSRSLDSASVCFWMRSDDRDNYGTPFSYATDVYDNSFTITDYNGFVIYVNGEKTITDIRSNDGFWHFICVTWSSLDGSWAIYLDGNKADNGTGLAANTTIEAAGTIVLGQEQDYRGGNYSPQESYIGELTLLNIWSNVLSPSQILTLYTNCQRYVGNLIGWPDFQSGIKGQVKLKASIFCRGCGVPSVPQYGSIQETTSNAGEVITVTCNEGFKLYRGSSERICLVYGMWSGNEPECRRVSCVFPGYLVNGHLEGNSYSYGDTVSYTCNPGFFLEGDAQLTCQADGKWSGERPQCTVIRCPHLSPGPHGEIVTVLGNYMPTNQISFRCDLGYQMDGPPTLTCGGEGEWDGDPPTCQSETCQEFPIIANGHVEGGPLIRPGDQAEVKCDVGYKLKGDPMITCKDDTTWSQPLPKCIIPKCSKPPPVENGQVKVRASTTGREAAYKCDLGYEVNGSKTIQCGADGEWDSGWSTCVGMPCPEPVVPHHASAPQKDVWRVGDTLTYDCDIGFQLQGSASLQCEYNGYEGQWSDPAPECHVVSCSLPTRPQNGAVTVVHRPHSTRERRPTLPQVFGELELRRRRSPDDFPLPLGYDGFPSYGSLDSKKSDPDWVPSDYNYDDYEQHSQSNGQTYDYDFSQLSENQDFGDQIEDLSNSFDAFSQSPSGFELTGQFSSGFDDFGQSSSQGISDDYSDYSQSQGEYSYQSSHQGLEMIQQEDSVYGTEVEYDCQPGYKLLGAQRRRCTESGEWDSPEPRCYEQFCSDLDTLQNGYIVYHGSGVNSRAEYICNEGYERVGVDFELLCQGDGTWLGEIPSCEIVDCGDPPDITNGTIDFTSTIYGSVAKYDCFVGFVIEGSFDRFCTSQGNWNGTIPKCIAVTCTVPPVIEDGYITFEGSMYVDSAIEYECKECYKLNGTQFRYCQLDGSWSSEEPSCSLIYCDEVPDGIPNGKVIGDDNSCGSLVEYECSPGYELKGRRTATCLENERWSSPTPTCERINCNPPKQIENGSYVGASFKFTDKVTYVCDEGHVLQGPTLQICEADGMWSDSQPFCAVVNCTKPQGPSNGRVRLSGLFFGSYADVVCDPGYQLQGDRHMMCNSQGNWDKEMPHCVPVICPPAPQVSYSFYNSTGYQFEAFTVLEYKCEDGYYQSGGSSMLTCNAQGQWEEEVIHCQPVDCGDPGTLPNGHITGSNYTFGGIVSFSCDEGYNILGHPTAECLADGSWSNYVTSCLQITCPEPLQIQFGKIMSGDVDNVFGEYVAYQCDNGYILSGDANRTCDVNGAWTGVEPECRPVTCPEPYESLNSEREGDLFEYSHQIRYTCNEGYSMKGDGVLTCQANGIWSDDVPVCEMIICEEIPELPHGSWEVKRLGEYPIKTEPLHTKTRSKGHSKNTGLAKLQALIEDELKEDVIHKFGDVVEFQCDSGYAMNSAGLLECSEGGWSTSFPQCHPITCPIPVNIRNGRLIGSDYTYQSVIRYECNEGYELIGETSRICQENKEWTDTEPFCREIECPRPAPLDNGKTFGQSVTYRSILSYICNNGFKLEGVTTRKCQSSGYWTDEQPVCIELFCELPDEVPNGIRDIGSLKVGGTVRYSCIEGYRMEGRPVINCDLNGNWDRQPPRCVQIDCGPPPSNEHVIIEGSDTTYGSQVIFECERGYSLDGLHWSTCKQSGRWSNDAPVCQLITCPPPTTPTHGHLLDADEGEEDDLSEEQTELEETRSQRRKKKGNNRERKNGTKRRKNGRKGQPQSVESFFELYRVDAEISWACEEGFLAVGQETAVCTEAGEWSSGPPRCQRISCGPPELPDHAQIDGFDFLYGANATYSCRDGYELQGSSVLVCQANSTWSSDPPICSPVSCGPPVISNQTKVRFITAEHNQPHSFGSTVSYSCSDGYKLEGGEFQVCESNGEWVGPPHTCEEKLCTDAPTLPNAISEIDRAARPQTVTFSCNRGYELMGEHIIECNFGEWEISNSTCEPINCFEPDIPLHGKITAKHFTYGSVANYSCMYGYMLLGNPSVVCDADGTWKGERPICQPVDCGTPEAPVNGHAESTHSDLGAEALYHCNPGYKLFGDDVRHCTTNASWSGNLPQCHRVDCGEVKPPQRGIVMGVETLYGDRIKFACEPGYVINGEAKAVCTETGVWSASTPVCEPVSCGAPPIPPNVVWDRTSGQVYVYKDELRYHCLEGHIPRGDLTTTCLQTGYWSDVRGQCSKISCGRPKINTDGAVILGRSFYYRDTVVYRCPPGKAASGSSKLTCLGDGSWSGDINCINKCNRRCYNGGVCLSNSLCSCPPGYTGDRCQHVQCPLSCLNGGLCTGPHRCTCLPGYAGARCQMPICESGCGAEGRCIGPNVCHCNHGYTGSTCETEDYDYYTNQDYSHHQTNYDDWDLVALRRNRPRLGWTYN